MSPGEFFTRATVWVALCAYALGAGLLLSVRREERRLRTARWAWTIGCAFFAVHVVCAFHFFHGWSHAHALDETARQTRAMAGVASGAGLFLNYLFALAWLGDVLWWWRAPADFDRRARWITAGWHGFAFFMVFNATVVFGHGPVRWLGVAICAALAALWWRRTRRFGE